MKLILGLIILLSILNILNIYKINSKYNSESYRAHDLNYIYNSNISNTSGPRKIEEDEKEEIIDIRYVKDSEIEEKTMIKGTNRYISSCNSQTLLSMPGEIECHNRFKYFN